LNHRTAECRAGDRQLSLLRRRLADRVDDAIDADRLFIFHINDAEDLPLEQLEDRHRLLPGLGILPLKQIVAALRRIGYDRIVSVEIFRPEYWERDPFELARDARAAVERVLHG
jgi:2-keto-myo-inositol isomerase